MKIFQKNGFKLWLMLMVFVLSGCELTSDLTTTTTIASSNEPSITTTVESTTSNTIESTATTPVTQTWMSTGKTLMFVDQTTYYDFSEKTLPTYLSTLDPGTTYVDIAEFVAFLSEGLVPVLANANATMVVSYGVEIPRLLRDEYGASTFAFTVTFDADLNEVTINDINIGNYMNAGSNFEYDSYLTLLDMDQSATDTSVTIDLFEYQIDIVKEQGKFYVPMYLANLLLSGNDLEVYEMGLFAIVYDSAVDFAALQEYFAPDETVSVATAAANTEKYLALYFDYFYGLKNDQFVDSYAEVLEPYALKDQTTFTAFHTALEAFLIDRNDLHTRMVTAGYNDPNFVYSESYPIGSKLETITEAQEVNACATRSEEFVERRFNRTLILEINAFTVNTKDYLEEIPFIAMTNVVIDLSCNTGGALLGVIELLTYMTDEPIEIKTINPLTGQLFVESYLSVTRRAESTHFYVITSPVTYSAANLFVSIVKDMNLGFVIGQDSLGGACAIQFTTLPDGTILVSSSHFALLNQAGELIEDGVEVDLEKELPIDWASYSLELGSLYAMLFDSSIAFSRDENHIFVQFDEIATSDLLTNVSYQAVIRHEGSTWVVEHSDFSGDFAFDYWIEAHDFAYVIAIEVTYQFNGETFTETLSSEVFDDHDNTFEFPVTHLGLNETITAGKYNRGDYDSFEITITEAAKYRITLNTGEFPSVWLHDGLGTFLKRGNDFDLVPGTYYLTVDYPSIAIYQVGLVILEDDTLEGVDIEIPSGNGSFDLIVDYSMDSEWFEFTLTERSLITFSLNLAQHQFYDFKTNGFTTYRSFPNIPGNELLKLILEPGNYLLTIRSMDVGTVTLQTTCTTEFVDYSDVFNRDPENYGILSLGMNTITFDAENDIDIYLLTITEETDIAFVFDSTLGFLNRIGYNLYSRYDPSTIHHFLPGTYYFEFIDLLYPDEDTMWCDLIAVDNTDDDLVHDVELGERIDTTSVSKADVDYFTFIAPETREYRFTWMGERITFKIYDSNHLLVFQSTKSRIYTLVAGRYTIEIGLFNTSYEQNQFVSLKIDYQISDDLFRNVTGLPIEFYTLMTIGIENTIHSSLDYDGDVDVFVFFVSTTSIYQFKTNSTVTIKIYDETGNSYSPLYGVTLTPGMYYFVVSQQNSTITEYNVWITKN